ncbi:MAG: diguanylate cyclase (GGDEF)-like protein [Planctomycetota bacterium]|jgi:diguanylate cyclase (GGDEF)-like protein
MRNGWRERWLDRLATMGAARVTGLSMVLLGSVGLLDWFSQADIAASLGYLLPISVAAWGAGRIGSVVAAAMCAGMWLTINLMTAVTGITPALELVNMVVLTVAFQLFGLLLATLRGQLDHERKLARTDPLTSVHNRRAFWSAAAREVARGRRHGTPFSLAYIDVDGFKSVNDTYGHRAGDELLRRIALALQEDLRELDMVARLGGDEFVILLPGAAEAGAGRVISRLQKRLANARWRQSFDIDFSIGVLAVVESPESVEQLVGRADALMYQVKRSGRGLVLFDVLRASENLPPTDVQKSGSVTSRIAT